MSHFTQGQKGVEAVEKKQWKEGIELLSKAIEQAKSPAWLLARAHAFQQTNELDRALADADLAFITASERTQAQSRSQMILAQYRRAVILYRMGRYADADACAVWSMQLVEGKSFRATEDDVSKNVDEDGDYKATAQEALSTASMPQQKGADGKATFSMGDQNRSNASEWTRAYVWRSRALGAMEKLPKGDPGRKITVQRVPPKPSRNVTDAPQKKEVVTAAPQHQTASAAKGTAPTPPKPTKLRVDFFQSAGKVNLSVYIKNANKDNVKVDLDENKVTLSGLPEDGAGHTTAVLDLGGSIDVGGSRNVRVTPYKIELVLDKKNPGTSWGTWGTVREPGAKPPVETSGPEATTSSRTDSLPASNPNAILPKNGAGCDSLPAAATAALSSSQDDNKTPVSQPAAAGAPAKKPAGPPAYPTSSKSGPRDWEKLVGPEDAAEEDDGADVNSFFRKLYANSTPDQQRAMMKSFVESNGTALSTDWDDVSKRQVETNPPDGVEEKKW